MARQGKKKKIEKAKAKAAKAKAAKDAEAAKDFEPKETEAERDADEMVREWMTYVDEHLAEALGDEDGKWCVRLVVEAYLGKRSREECEREMGFVAKCFEAVDQLVQVSVLRFATGWDKTWKSRQLLGEVGRRVRMLRALDSGSTWKVLRLLPGLLMDRIRHWW